MKLLDHMYILFLDFFLVDYIISIFTVAFFAIKPIIKHFRRIKDFRKQKIKQTP